MLVSYVGIIDIRTKVKLLCILSFFISNRTI